MRYLFPLLVSAMFVVAAAQAQPAGSAAGGTAGLSPNNCGTPDQPKPCPGTKAATKSHPAHKAATHPAKPQ